MINSFCYKPDNVCSRIVQKASSIQLYDTFKSSPKKPLKDPRIRNNNEKILLDHSYVRLCSDTEKNNIMMMNKCDWIILPDWVDYEL